MNETIEIWEKNGMKSLTKFPTVNILGYELHMLTNVMEFVLYLPHFCHVKTNDCITQGNHETYFIIDTPNHNSFGHFLFESSIYMSIYKKLKKLFDGIKVLLVSSAKYKLLILKHFGIDENDIVSTFRTHDNVCFIPQFKQCSLNSNDYVNEFNRALSIIYPIYNNHKYFHIKKNIDIMIMPRHKVENNPPTDRIIDTTDIENHLSQIPNCEVFDTSTIDSLENQIDKIKRTEILVIPDGSSILVNGFFASNSIIIVLGFGTINQANTEAPKIKYVHKYIAMNNTVIFITNRQVINSKNIKYTYDMIHHIIEQRKEVLGKLIQFNENMYIDNTGVENIKPDDNNIVDTKKDDESSSHCDANKD